MFSRLKMEDFDQTQFMAPKCHTLYYADILRTNLFLERGIFLYRVPEKLLTFHDRLVSTGWNCFASDPCWENENWVRDLYTNHSIVSFYKPVVRIWWKNVHLRVNQINNLYGLPNEVWGSLRQKNVNWRVGWLKNYVLVRRFRRIPYIWGYHWMTSQLRQGYG